MRNPKTFVLAALAALAVAISMGLGSASATELYSGATTLGAGTEIVFSQKGSSLFSTTEGTTLQTCTSSELVVKTSNSGSSTTTVKGTANRYTLEGCLFPTITVETGEVEIHWSTGGNAIITTKGFKVLFSTPLFGNCTFTGGAGTTTGTLTGSTTENATWDVNAVLTRESGLCPSSLKWVSTYKITKPTPLHGTAS
jgi:hypothetical protein